MYCSIYIYICVCVCVSLYKTAIRSLSCYPSIASMQLPNYSLHRARSNHYLSQSSLVHFTPRRRFTVSLSAFFYKRVVYIALTYIAAMHQTSYSDRLVCAASPCRPLYYQSINVRSSPRCREVISTMTSASPCRHTTLRIVVVIIDVCDWPRLHPTATSNFSRSVTMLMRTDRIMGVR